MAVPVNTMTALVEGTFMPVAKEKSAEIPDGVVLHANFPNPVRESTTITLEVREPTAVSLVLYDVFGRRVESLLEGTLTADVHRVTVPARALASGLYTYRLQTGSATRAGTMLVMK